jgi:hypothetical protein
MDESESISVIEKNVSPLNPSIEKVIQFHRSKSNITITTYDVVMGRSVEKYRE